MNTNYIPLYRKYRPQTIEQIVGQEHIKRALANAIKTDRISHAYLFTGPRGTGKTSTARIFAKSLNCEKGPTISPCNECENCKNITNSIPIDVIEIDAASNRSVSDADEIIQKVALAPVQSRYKIYIIDEVHMLTNQAFNALLKTLEEPPKNVIFILATTEVHKVLDTIKSRCQRFDFKRITTDDITKHLRFIADNEKINISDEALQFIAQNSAGGMRDSIALLDQLSILNSEDKQITVEDINSLLGRLSFGDLTSIFESITDSNQNSALQILNGIYNSGNEPVQILSNLLEYLRNALIVKTAGDVNNSVVQLNSEQVNSLKALTNKIEAHQILSLTEKCADYIKELKLSTNPKLWLDIAILDLANLTENTKLEDLQKRLSLLEGGEVVSRPINSSPYNTPPSPVSKPEIIKTVNIKQPKDKTVVSEEEVLTSEVPMSKPAQNDEIKSVWAKFLENISSFPSKTILKQQGIPIKLTQEEVIITIKNPNWLKQFGADGSKHDFIVSAAKATFGTLPKIIIREPKNGDKALKSDPPTTQQTTESEVQPVQTKQKTVTEEISKEDVSEAMLQQPQPKHKKTGDEFNHSDEVNMIMDLFDGKMIE